MTYFRKNQRQTQYLSNSGQKSELKSSRPVQKWNKSNKPASVRQINECQKDWSDTMNNFMQDFTIEDNKSMEDMLDSSINHFTRYIQENQTIKNQNSHLIQQNLCLKSAIEQLRMILKQKLEQALKKQRQDLNIMMQDYIVLIQKLLKDKQDYANKTQQAVLKANQSQLKLQQLYKIMEERQYQHLSSIENKTQKIQKLEDIIKIQAEELKDTKNKADLYLKQNDELKAKIINLSQKQLIKQNIVPQVEKIIQKDHQNPQKTKLLLDMLLQSQQQMKKLRQKLKQSLQQTQKNQLIQNYELRIKQIQIQHQEQFNQYDLSMRQMLKTKDQQIQKLNNMMFSYRKQINSSSTLST